jgi:hypothetical protein
LRRKNKVRKLKKLTPVSNWGKETAIPPRTSLNFFPASIKNKNRAILIRRF